MAYSLFRKGLTLSTQTTLGHKGLYWIVSVTGKISIPLVLASLYGIHACIVSAVEHLEVGETLLLLMMKLVQSKIVSTILANSNCRNRPAQFGRREWLLRIQTIVTMYISGLLINSFLPIRNSLNKQKPCTIV